MYYCTIQCNVNISTLISLSKLFLPGYVKLPNGMIQNCIKTGRLRRSPEVCKLLIKAVTISTVTTRS